MEWAKYIQEPKYLVLGIATGLIALHLTLIGRTNNLDLLGSSMLFWGAVAFLVSDKQEQLRWESGVFSSFFGATLITFILLRSLSINGYDIFLRFLPFLAAFSVALMASGWKGLKQYWQELAILCFLMIPPGLPAIFIDVAQITAKFTGFILWYLGFHVIREGLSLKLPNGTVVVEEGCSGVSVILQLLGLSIILLFMFPELKLNKKIIAPIVAIFLAFIVNSIRVALLAVLVAYSNKESFEYWHKGTGSLIFSMIAVAIFGLFCQFVLLRDDDVGKQNLT